MSLPPSIDHSKKLTSPQTELERETADLRSLVDALYEQSGVDFRNYAFSSLKRRVMRCVKDEKVGSLPALRELLLSNAAALLRFQLAITVHVTAMFRDPGFFIAFREHAVAVLRTYPFLRIWIAGCSTGEEVYSLAILLHEEGLYDRCRIYATDVSDPVLSKAQAGIFPLAAMRDYTRNYQKAGGQQAFAEYYTADSDFAVFRPFLRENVIFASHNLAGDASFNEFHAIFCRNVMIYFDRQLQTRVHRLFDESLLTYGYLGLGRSETMRFTFFESSYEPVVPRERLYRKIA